MPKGGGISQMKANVKNDPYYGWSPNLSLDRDIECASVRKCFQPSHDGCLNTCRESQSQLGYQRDYIEANIPKVDDDWIPNPHMLHQMFVDGVDKKQYGYLLKNMETDYSLGNKDDVSPAGIEEALQVLILYSEKKLNSGRKIQLW